MSKPILYTSFVSPGGRAVQFTAHYLNIDFDIIEISLLNNEQLTPEYLKVSYTRKTENISKRLVICNNIIGPNVFFVYTLA